MKKNKKRKLKFFVLGYKDEPEHYFQGSRCLSTPLILKAERYRSRKEALKKRPNKDLNVYKVIVTVRWNKKRVLTNRVLFF